MNAIEVLTALDGLRRELHCQREKIACLEEAARYLSPAGDAVSHGGPSDRVGKIAVQIADERSKLEELEERYSNAVTDAMQILDKLTDPLAKEILAIRYIAGDKWETVASKVNCSIRKCYQIHREALQKVSS